MLIRFSPTILIATIILYLFLSLLSYYSTQYILTILAIAIFYSLTVLDRSKTTFLSLYAFLGLISIFATLYQVFGNGLEYSWYQFFRSGIFTLIFPLLLIVDIRRFFERYRNLIAFFCFFVGVGAIADAYFQTNFSPSYIRTSNGTRIYSILFPLAPFLMLYGIRNKNTFLFIGSIMILIASGGKIALYMIFIVFALSFYENINFSRLSIIRKSFFYFLTVFTFLGVFLFNFTYEKINFILEFGDASRLNQAIQVIEAVDKNIESLIFGLGHGTRIIDGNYLYYSEMTDSPRLLINSQYDVEVGYLHLLARFGILGICILLVLIVKSPVSISHFFWFFIIPFMGSSLAGIAPVSAILGLSLLRIDEKKYD